MQRFEALWRAWDDHLLAGGSPPSLLQTLSDEDVIKMLAGAPERRRLERNVLATEALNRLTRTRRAIHDTAEAISEELFTVLAAVEESTRGAADRDTSAVGYDARNAAREAALEHVQSKAALAALERASLKLKLLSGSKDTEDPHAARAAAGPNYRNIERMRSPALAGRTSFFMSCARDS